MLFVRHVRVSCILLPVLLDIFLQTRRIINIYLSLCAVLPEDSSPDVFVLITAFVHSLSSLDGSVLLD